MPIALPPSVAILTTLMETPPLPRRELERLLVEREEEIRKLRLALDVLSPVDPISGMINRNGVIDAIEDALNWLVRRSERFAILTVEVPDLARVHADGNGEHRSLHQHLEAVLTATVRRVDRVGYLDHVSYAAVLREFKSEGSTTVIERVRSILRVEQSENLATDALLTLAIVGPGPGHEAGRLLERIESHRSKATLLDPYVIEL